MKTLDLKEQTGTLQAIKIPKPLVPTNRWDLDSIALFPTVLSIAEELWFCVRMKLQLNRQFGVPETPETVTP
eukprot:1741790-Amphidinium_carterae.1